MFQVIYTCARRRSVHSGTSGAAFSRTPQTRADGCISKPDLTPSAARVDALSSASAWSQVCFFCCFFFLFIFNNIKTQTQILALALLFPGCSVPSRSLRLLSNVSCYFCDCSHTAPSPSIHHASVLLVRPPLPPLHMSV